MRTINDLAESASYPVDLEELNRRLRHLLRRREFVALAVAAPAPASRRRRHQVARSELDIRQRADS